MSDLWMIAIGAVAGAFAYSFLRALRRRVRARRRTVEPPNSYYVAKAARDSEIEQRWRAISLDRVHEINREEVKRLLDKVAVLGVDSLAPRERLFLDHLASLSG
jgi:hypothetical protein